MIALIKKALPSRKNALARNTGWAMAGEASRQVFRAAYFLLVARALGASHFGEFVGVTAMIAVLSPFASLGSGNLLIKNVSVRRNLFAVCWGNALFMCVVSGAFLLLVALAIRGWVLSSLIPFSLVLWIGIADLIFSRILDVSNQAFQAVERLKDTATIAVIFSAARLVGAIGLVAIVRVPTPAKWAVFYLISTAVASLISVFKVYRQLGRPSLDLSRIRREVKEGSYFSVSISAQTIYNDIDKTMLVRLSSTDAAGIYAAAYRLIDVTMVPIQSLLSAAYPRFFQHGSEGGAKATAQYARRFLPKATLYGIVAVVALFVFSPALPWFLGPQYNRAAEALRWLAPLPLFKIFHRFFADALTGAGYQGVRAGVQVVVAVLNVLVNLWIIRWFSWRGAAWSSLLCDGLLALSLYCVLSLLSRKMPHLPKPAVACSVSD
jgi:O-antigen/teichoic acid export membrane protein